MSNLVNYSNFGTTLNNTSIEALRGEPGFGFAVDEFGNYDIQGNDMIGINDITINNDIIYTSPETNNNLVTVLSRDSTDDNKIKETDLNELFNDINVNTISKKDNSFIQVNNNTAFNSGKILISDIDTNITDCSIHVKSNTDACIYLQADRDNIGSTDNPFIYGSQNGGNSAFGLQLDALNIMRITQGNTAGSTNGIIELYTAEVVDNGDNRFDFQNSQRIARFDIGDIDFDTDLDMNANNINAVNNIVTETIDINNLSNDNTKSDFVVWDSITKELKYKNDVYIPDQSVNIDSSPQFTNVKLDSIVSKTSGLSVLNVSSGTVSIPANTLLGLQDRLQFTEIPAPTTPTGLNSIVYRRLGSIKAKGTDGIEHDLINDFNQNLNTNNDVTFNKITSTTDIVINNDLDMTNGNIDNCLSIDSSTVNTNTLNTNGAGFINLLNSMSLVGSGKNITVSSGNDLILTSRVLDNSLTNMLVLDGSNIVKRKTIFYDYNTSLTLSSTTLTTFQTKVTLITSIPATQFYEIGISCIFGNLKKDGESALQCTLNGTPLNTVEINNPVFKNDGQVTCQEMRWIRNLTAGSNTILLRYRNINDTTSIQDAKIWVRSI